MLLFNASQSLIKNVLKTWTCIMCEKIRWTLVACGDITVLLKAMIIFPSKHGLAYLMTYFKTHKAEISCISAKGPVKITNNLRYLFQNKSDVFISCCFLLTCRTSQVKERWSSYPHEYKLHLEVETRDWHKEFFLIDRLFLCLLHFSWIQEYAVCLCFYFLLLFAA